MDPMEDYMDRNIYRTFCVILYYSITILLILLLLLARVLHTTQINK